MLNKPKIFVLHLFYFVLYYWKKVCLSKIYGSEESNRSRFESNTKHKLKLIKYLD